MKVLTPLIFPPRVVYHECSLGSAEDYVEPYTAGEHSKYQVGSTVHTKTSIFPYFYEQHLILFTTVAPRKTTVKMCCDLPVVS